MRTKLAGLAGRGVLVGEPDERLVELAGDGDERAFAAIVERYQAPLLRYCLRYLPPGSADDALQQTFINAHAVLSRERGNAPATLRPWLYRIAHNAALNVARDPQVGLARVPESLDGRQQPEDLFQQREDLDRVLGAMKALPENQREVIARHELAGDSHERIAADLGLSAGAVRQLAYRARAAVRAAAAALIPGPLVRLLPWLAGGPESAAVGSSGVLAKTAVALVIAGVAGGGAVSTMSGREDVRTKPRPHSVAAETSREAAAPRRAAVLRVAPPVVRTAPSSGGAAPAPVRRADRSGQGGGGSSGSGSGSGGSGSGSNSGSGGGSNGSGSGSNSGSDSGSSGPGSGSSGSGSGPGSGVSSADSSGGPGSGTSGSSSGPGSDVSSAGSSSGPGSGSSGSGSASSGSGKGSSGSDDAAEPPTDDHGGSSGPG